jgi:hypothetical protein
MVPVPILIEAPTKMKDVMVEEEVDPWEEAMALGVILTEERRKEEKEKEGIVAAMMVGTSTRQCPKCSRVLAILILAVGSILISIPNRHVIFIEPPIRYLDSIH